MDGASAIRVIRRYAGLAVLAAGLASGAAHAADPPPGDRRPTVSVSPSSLSFYHRCGQRAAPLGVRIANDGRDDLRITAVNVRGNGFTTSSACTGRRLDAREACEVVVNFTPTLNKDVETGSLEVRTTGGNASVYLEGRRCTAPTSSP